MVQEASISNKLFECVSRADKDDHLAAGRLRTTGQQPFNSELSDGSARTQFPFSSDGVKGPGPSHGLTVY